MTRVLRFWPIIAGACAALGQSPWGLWSVSLMGFVAAFCAFAKSEAPKIAALKGWFFGLGYFLVALSWLVHPFLVEPLRHGWLIPFALLGMCGGLALLWAGAFFLAKTLKLHGVGLAGLWAAVELLRAYLFTGFPWALPSYIWLDWGPAQLASYVGPYGLTALTLFICAVFADAIVKKSQLRGAFGGLALAAMFATGVWTGLGKTPTDHDQIIRLVQPNAPQHQKWDPLHIPTFYQRAVLLSAPEGADLVIWPETALATPLHYAAPYFREIAEQSAPAEIILGLNRIDGMRGYNSAVHVGADGLEKALYDKHHLVPFGEYMPLPGLLERLGLSAFTAKGGSGYSAGPGPVLLDFGALGKALPLICYEAIFPRDSRTVERPDWLMQLTNDAWFGTNAGPKQALAQARFRAIETGLPMVRAANTGVSAIIGPRGDVRQFIPLGASGAINGALPQALPETAYSRFKEWPAIALFTLLFVIGLVATFPRTGNKPIDL